MSIAIPIPLLVAAVSTADAGGRRDEFYDSRGVGLIPATTLVIWVCCLLVGVVGMIWPGGGSGAPTTQPQAEAIEAIEVQVTNEPAPPSDRAGPPQITQIAPAAALPPAPVISADPFARLLPWPPMQAAPAKSPPSVAPVQNLSYGYGEGRQPKPEYPEEAQYAGQEGTVTILINVSQDGNVLSAVAVKPCRWPILNEAATRSIRQTWHFSPGALRSYIISIKYEVKKS